MFEIVALRADFNKGWGLFVVTNVGIFSSRRDALSELSLQGTYQGTAPMVPRVSVMVLWPLESMSLAEL